MKMTMNRLFVTMTLAALLCSGNVMARNPQKPEKRELTPAERMDASLKRLEGRLRPPPSSLHYIRNTWKRSATAVRNVRKKKARKNVRTQR